MAEHACHADAEEGEYIGHDQAEDDKARTGRFQIFQAPGGCHAHFQKEKAEHALEKTDEKLIVGGCDIGALQTAQESDENAAEKQENSRVQENFPNNHRAYHKTLLRSRIDDWYGRAGCW